MCYTHPGQPETSYAANKRTIMDCLSGSSKAFVDGIQKNLSTDSGVDPLYIYPPGGDYAAQSNITLTDCLINFVVWL